MSEDLQQDNTPVINMSSSESQDVTNSTTPKFDPNKSYTWTQDIEIKLTGSEFGMVLNALRAFSEAAGIAQVSSKVIEGVLIRNVENGIIIEAEQQQN